MAFLLLTDAVQAVEDTQRRRASHRPRARVCSGGGRPHRSTRSASTARVAHCDCRCHLLCARSLRIRTALARAFQTPRAGSGCGFRVPGNRLQRMFLFSAGSSNSTAFQLAFRHYACPLVILAGIVLPLLLRANHLQLRHRAERGSLTFGVAVPHSCYSEECSGSRSVV